MPPGAAVIREGDLITRIESPLVNSGETDVSGIDVRARSGWKADWADLVLDARWSRVNPGTRTAWPTRCSRATIRATAFMHRFARAGVASPRAGASTRFRATGMCGKPPRYKAWMGHDITLRWRDAFGLGGMDLTGGILNVGDRGPSTDPTNPGSSGAVETPGFGPGTHHLPDRQNVVVTRGRAG